MQKVLYKYMLYNKRYSSLVMVFYKIMFLVFYQYSSLVVAFYKNMFLAGYLVSYTIFNDKSALKRLLNCVALNL